MIAYVPPHSLVAVLEAAAAELGPARRCVVARELTKLHEELFRTSLAGAAEHYVLNAPRVTTLGPVLEELRRGPPTHRSTV